MLLEMCFLVNIFKWWLWRRCRVIKQCGGLDYSKSPNWYCGFLSSPPYTTVPIHSPPGRHELDRVASLPRTFQRFPIALRVMSKIFPTLMNLGIPDSRQLFWPRFLPFLPPTSHSAHKVFFLVSPNHRAFPCPGAWLNPHFLGELFSDSLLKIGW